MTDQNKPVTADLDQLDPVTKPTKPAVWEQQAQPLRETTRRWIAGGLLLGYLLLVAGVLRHIYRQDPATSDSKELLILLITSYTTLLGSALGTILAAKRINVTSDWCWD